MTSAPPSALLVSPSDDSTNAVVAEELRDVKPPVPIHAAWPFILGALLLALVAALALAWAIRRKRRRPPTPQPKVVVPPHRRAQDKLRAALDCIHDPETFIVRVADALRWYLEQRFELNAPDRTSEEFLDEIQSTPYLTLDQKRALADFLTRCDLVKFAQAQPTEIELRGLWDVAMALVCDTADTAPALGSSNRAERPESA